MPADDSLLDEALDVWRDTRAPEVAAAVDALGAKALQGFAGPKGRTKKAFHAAWVEAAGDADTVLRARWPPRSR